MTINADLIKRWLRSRTIHFSSLLMTLGGMLASLDPASQAILVQYLGEVTVRIGISPVRVAGIVTLLLGFRAGWLRFQTTKPLSER